MEARLDLTTCDNEPIHIPGAIQPHGILISLDASTGLITHVSANAQELLGADPVGLIGQGPSKIVAWDYASLSDVDEGRPTYLSTCQLVGSNTTWDAIAHRHLNQIFIEFEPSQTPAPLWIDQLYRNLQDSLARMERSGTIRDLSRLATIQVRQLCGFDRVMLYRFDKDWNGKVIAEDRRDDLEPFEGLNYPASDIPRQARALYTKNWLRFITNRDYTPSPIVAGPGATAPLDMSYSVLRSVSPIHLEYLRNMGVHASMSISLLHEGKLWGLIACHHYSPLFVAYNVRKACELLGHFMSLQIVRVQTAEAQSERTRLFECSQTLATALKREEDLVNAIIYSEPNLLQFIPAAGAAVVNDSNITRLGQTPNESEIRQLAAWLSQQQIEVYSNDELGKQFGTRLMASVAAGILAINLGHNRLHQVIWFRPERVRTVNWAGDPRKIADTSEAERLSPRGSFALWRETVRGQCEPWTPDEIAAARDFRLQVVQIMLRRAELIAVVNDDLRLASLEREKALESERQARLESDRLNRIKDEFVATLSHELRTPLNAILGWTQLLQMSDSIDTAELQEGLEVIERNAKSQATMIEDLLEISRIVSGRMRLDLQEVDFAEIVENTLESLSVAAAGKKIRVEKIIDPLVGVSASGDPNRLRQIVWNLLSNAIKFTPQGGKIQIFLEKVDSHVELTVADTGIGIKREFLPHIFERYRQADPSITRQYGGLGLGLAIVRNLVELHGGNISVDSKGENQGTTFTVSLPIRVMKSRSDDQLHKAVLDRPAPQFDLSGISILVVDDEDDARQLISRVLSNAGCTVECADCAEAALERGANGRFSLVISDIGMAGQDGYTLIRNWRQHELKKQIAKVPAIALTAYARADDRRRALLAGFNAHLTKPVDATELLTVVASMTDRIKNQD